VADTSAEPTEAQVTLLSGSQTGAETSGHTHDDDVANQTKGLAESEKSPGSSHTGVVDADGNSTAGSPESTLIGGLRSLVSFAGGLMHTTVTSVPQSISSIGSVVSWPQNTMAAETVSTENEQIISTDTAQMSAQSTIVGRVPRVVPLWKVILAILGIIVLQLVGQPPMYLNLLSTSIMWFAPVALGWLDQLFLPSSL